MNKGYKTSHKNRIPLYLQMARVMRQKIESQEWAFGEQIPTLKELEDEYQVSRITLRAALAYLEEFGIIERMRGRGTFVSKDLSKERWFKLANTFDELVEKVAALNVKLLKITESERPPTPTFVFGKVGTSYKHMRRVHFHDEEPYCLIDIYLDKDIFNLAPEGFTQAPAITQLAERNDIQVAGGKQIMRIVVADEAAAKHLRIGVGEPIAEVCRTLVDKNDRIIYYAQIQYPSQMIQIETNLMPNSTVATELENIKKPHKGKETKSTSKPGD